jgi:lia operon protein LiaG
MFFKNNFKKIIILLISIMFFSYGTGYYILAKSPNKIDVNTIITKLEKLDIDYVHIGNWSNLSAYNINETKTQSLNNTNNINISLVSGDISVIPYEGNEIKATIKGSVKGNWGNDLPKLQLITSGNTVEVKFDKDISALTSFNIVDRLKLDIYIPSSFNENIAIESVSSDIQVSDLNVKMLSINTTSGDVKLNNISITNLKFNSTSGELIADSLNSTSNIIETTSGDVDINNITGDLTFESISGNIISSYKEFENNIINIKLTSGDSTLSLPLNSSFYANFSTTSGDIKIDFPVTVNETSKTSLSGSVGNTTPKSKITISTVSGEISIKK